ECTGDLLGQAIVQAVDQVADVIGDVADVQVLPTAVAGVEDLPEIGQDVDDLAVTGERRMAQVVDRAAVLVGLADPACDRRQPLVGNDLGRILEFWWHLASLRGARGHAALEGMTRRRTPSHLTSTHGPNSREARPDGWRSPRKRPRRPSSPGPRR